ncbi:PIN domain-containing protein [Kocuria rhizophila]|uniref:PIN domain-containing protein n=1 Tax=Kocuria rhizophila TaxID=72000 RepID=UPI001ADD2219|nr:PIN domain-containing protein [Kocuria rhizophila]MDN3225961.1 PIN domain-containing protein [Kocuria rhizophila]QTK31508.1 PIN domain-containing protein [Kocuria rhizophila]WSQ06135.1 PIN domain-containing protein [Kocuria rhizophila]
MTQRVFVDANVLFSKTLMDWLFLLHLDNPTMFQLHSTEDVFAEVIANMRKKYPTAPGRKTARRAQLMRDNMDEVLVDFPSDLHFTGADPQDYHVHAGAVHGRADVVLTCNTPQDITMAPDTEPYDIVHPDDFFVLVADSHPACLIPIVRKQLSYWGARANHVQLDEALSRAGCPQFARRVRRTLSQIARMP